MQVPLTYSQAKHDEHNWLPWTVANGTTLLISYSICPHVVLRCEPQSGFCTLVHSTPCPGRVTNIAGRAPPGTLWTPMRGGSPPVRMDATHGRVGVAHKYETLGGSRRAELGAGAVRRRYAHFFCARACGPADVQTQLPPGLHHHHTVHVAIYIQSTLATVAALLQHCNARCEMASPAKQVCVRSRAQQ